MKLTPVENGKAKVQTEVELARNTQIRNRYCFYNDTGKKIKDRKEI